MIKNHELDLQIERMIERSEGIWRCPHCNKSATKKEHIKIHAETHIEGVSHTCHICSKTCSTRNSLKMHITDNHSQLSFSCNICDKSGMNRKALMNHKHRNH